MLNEDAEKDAAYPMPTKGDYCSVCGASPNGDLGRYQTVEYPRSGVTLITRFCGQHTPSAEAGVVMSPQAATDPKDGTPAPTSAHSHTPPIDGRAFSHPDSVWPASTPGADG